MFHSTGLQRNVKKKKCGVLSTRVNYSSSQENRKKMKQKTSDLQGRTLTFPKNVYEIENKFKKPHTFSQRTKGDMVQNAEKVHLQITAYASLERNSVILQQNSYILLRKSKRKKNTSQFSLENPILLRVRVRVGVSCFSTGRLSSVCTQFNV